MSAWAWTFAQDQNYHRFADERTLIGVANGADVISSLALVAVGLIGLRASGPYRAFFGAVALAGLGSIYYHLAPDDARLVWDRLPIALAAMALLAAVIGERVNARAGTRLLVPLMVLGAASVLYWARFDDLLPYGLVQFGSLVVVLGVGLHRKAGALVGAVVLYGVAKFFELNDGEVYRFTGEWLSGHTLKHLVAAAAVYVIFWGARYRAACR